MTLSSELMNAILSMDAYNRGYDAGITLPSNVGDRIGQATIITTSTISLGEGVDAAASFYAIAYGLTDGSTVVSYRGTDDPVGNILDGDIWNGWSIGIGSVGGHSKALKVNLSL